MPRANFKVFDGLYKAFLRPLYGSTIWIHLGDISEIKTSRYFVAIPHLINK
jgi:hypothetical protein